MPSRIECVYTMPDSGWIDATGVGWSAIGGGAMPNVLWLLVHVVSITSAKVRVFGGAYPRRLMFAGSLQLTAEDTDSLGNVVHTPFIDWPVSFEFRELDMPVANFGAYAVSGVRWELPPGVEVKVKVFW